MSVDAAGRGRIALIQLKPCYGRLVQLIALGELMPVILQIIDPGRFEAPTGRRDLDDLARVGMVHRTRCNELPSLNLPVKQSHDANSKFQNRPVSTQTRRNGGRADR